MIKLYFVLSKDYFKYSCVQACATCIDSELKQYIPLGPLNAAFNYTHDTGLK